MIRVLITLADDGNVSIESDAPNEAALFSVTAHAYSLTMAGLVRADIEKSKQRVALVGPAEFQKVAKAMTDGHGRKN